MQGAPQVHVALNQVPCSGEWTGIPDTLLLSRPQWRDRADPKAASALATASSETAGMAAFEKSSKRSKVSKQKGRLAQSKAANDRAYIRARPNPIPFSGEQATTVISWDTGDGSVGEVWVSGAGGQETLFARKPRGEQAEERLSAGMTYTFRLCRAGRRKDELAAVTVIAHPAPEMRLEHAAEMEVESPPAAPLAGHQGELTPHEQQETKPYIRAVPNPIPRGPGSGTATISWSTGTGKMGIVYLACDGGEEVPFARGAEGSQPVAWIRPDIVYRFRLYEDGPEQIRLAATTVKVGQSARDTALDVAVLTGLAAIPAGLLAGVVVGGRRLVRRAISNRR